MKQLLLTNIGMLATPVGSAAKGGKAQGDVQVLTDAWVFIEDGIIDAVGVGKPPYIPSATVLD